MAEPELKRAGELIYPINCTVKSVNGSRESPNHNTRRNLSLEIAVESPDAPAVKRINFPEWPPLEKGDMIRAYILKGVEKSPRWQAGGGLYAARDFREQEHALKIEKLRGDEVVASYSV